MNQIPNVDRVEEIVEEFDKLYVVHCSDGDILDGMVDAKKVKDWIRTTLHQQLQKARQDWLREEIVKLEGMKYPTSYCGYAFRSTTVETKAAVDCINGAEKMGRNKALQTIIDRYHSELDQDKK